MTGDMAADAVTGMLAARAVEPHAGETHGRRHGLCLNCGTALIGEHCHHCGQSGHVHRTVGAIGHELAHGVFHFEGKIWRTLPMLAFRPGELTRRYVAGERARFVSPLALFLFSVFLMFAVVANLPGGSVGSFEGLTDNGTVERARSELADELAQARAKAAKAERRVAELKAEPGHDPSALTRAEATLADARQAITGIEKAQSVLPGAQAGLQVTSKSSWIETKLSHAKENPKLLLYKLKSSAYKYSWALIPLSLPFIWLLFPFRRDVGLYDHAVFATYSLSFMSLLVITLAVLAAIGFPGGWLVFAALLIPPFHIYKQLKGAYRLSRWGGLWRTAWMLLFASLASIAFVVLLLALNLTE